MLRIPVVLVLSVLLVANCAFRIFAVTALECLGKWLFIDALVQHFSSLQGWGWVVAFIRIK